MAKPEIARPLGEWAEEDGDVLWWVFPIEEAPWVGSPLSLGYTVEIWTRDAPESRMVMRGTIGGWPGYHTHWTPLPLRPVKPKAPRVRRQRSPHMHPIPSAGGRARAAKLTPEQRREIAVFAAKVRWGDRVPHA